jgi:hypothetical protein
VVTMKLEFIEQIMSTHGHYFTKPIP